MQTLLIVALALSLVVTILAFIFVVPQSKRKHLNKFGKFLHDTVNFKYLIIEKILQALYIFVTACVILLGFLMLFYVEPGYSSYFYSTPSVWLGGYGLLIMFVGPVVVRFVYEILMLAILLIKNVIQINNKIKNESQEDQSDIFSGPVIEKIKKPAGWHCQACGTKVKFGNFCPNCGTKCQ